jgi:hypothetical protein
MGEYAGRPIGFNGKPIRKGLLYSDYTPQQIEKMVGSPNFEEKCTKAKEYMDKALELMLKIADKEAK